MHSTLLAVCCFFGICLLSTARTLQKRNIAECDLTLEPHSWLTTKARGIWDWATVGISPNGPHFCLRGNEATYSIEVDYHVDQTNVRQSANKITKEYHGLIPKYFQKNSDCGTGDKRIHYCVSYCWLNNTAMIYEAALSSKKASVVAKKIYDNLDTAENHVVTVLSVNLNAIPQAHLIQQMIMGDPSYCSVYIGMETVGIPYLYEIQIAKVFPTT